ncbi:hypothetical protein ACC771_19095, partial [Rhizobium ruizarguesonis]
MGECGIDHPADLGPAKGKVNAAPITSLEVAEIDMTHFAKRRIRILKKPAQQYEYIIIYRESRRDAAGFPIPQAASSVLR